MNNYEELTLLLNEKRYIDFINTINEMNVVDTADFLMTIDIQELPKVFRMLKKDVAADIFAELDSELQQQIIEAMQD